MREDKRIESTQYTTLPDGKSVVTHYPLVLFAEPKKRLPEPDGTE